MNARDRIDDMLRRIDDVTAEPAPPTATDLTAMAAQLDDGTPDGRDFAQALHDASATTAKTVDLPQPSRPQRCLCGQEVQAPTVPPPRLSWLDRIRRRPR